MLLLFSTIAFGYPKVDEVKISVSSFVMGCDNPEPKVVTRTSHIPTLADIQEIKRHERFMKECLKEGYLKSECLWQDGFRKSKKTKKEQGNSAKKDKKL